jgi:predicted nucleotidyltransferase
VPSLIQKKSYGSVRVFWLDRERALSVLRGQAKKLLEERNEVRAVVLFGSLAENRATPGSDADILIVLSSSEERFIDRPLSYQPYFEEVGLPVDLFCYTEEEVGRIPSAKKALGSGMKLAD